MDSNHAELLLKSYQVIIKTLQIRRESIKDLAPDQNNIQEVLKDKIALYTEKVKMLEEKLDVAKH